MTGFVVMSAQLNGLGAAANYVINVPAAVSINQSIAAGKAGSLTVRTDANTGTVTMADAGHGLVAGNRVSVFWLDPVTGAQLCQYKSTVGIVSGVSVPIDLGLGDNLPVAATAVVVCIDTEIDYALLAVNLEMLAVGGTGGGKVVLEGAAGAVAYHKTVGIGGVGAVWAEESGSINPVSIDVLKAYIANASAVAANVVTVVAGLNA